MKPVPLVATVGFSIAIGGAWPALGGGEEACDPPPTEPSLSASVEPVSDAIPRNGVVVLRFETEGIDPIDVVPFAWIELSRGGNPLDFEAVDVIATTRNVDVVLRPTSFGGGQLLPGDLDWYVALGPIWVGELSLWQGYSGSVVVEDRDFAPELVVELPQPSPGLEILDVWCCTQLGPCGEVEDCSAKSERETPGLTAVWNAPAWAGQASAELHWHGLGPTPRSVIETGDGIFSSPFSFEAARDEYCWELEVSDYANQRIVTANDCWSLPDVDDVARPRPSYDGWVEDCLDEPVPRDEEGESGDGAEPTVATACGCRSGRSPGGAGLLLVFAWCRSRTRARSTSRTRRWATPAGLNVPRRARWRSVGRPSRAERPETGTSKERESSHQS